MITASLIGDFCLVDSERSRLKIKSKKAACIIAYLLLAKNRIVRRELITSLLWSEADEVRGRASLRQVIRDLRRVSESASKPFIVIDNQSIALKKEAITCDVESIFSALKCGDTSVVDQLLAGTEPNLLAGFNDIDPLFDSWLRVENENIKSGIVERAIARLTSLSTSDTSHRTLSDVILSVDPFAEIAIEIQIKDCLKLGNKQKALAIFESYKNRLKHEYELEPSKELSELANSISMFSAGIENAHSSISKADPDSFNNTNGETNVEEVSPSKLPLIAVCIKVSDTNDGSFHVSEAFRNDLFATMSRFNEWAVSNMDIDHADNGVASSEKRLLRFLESGMDYVVECRANLVGENIIEVQVYLFDCVSRKTTLLKEHSIKAHEQPALLNEVTSKIASYLQRFILKTRLHKIRSGSVNVQQAYDYWLEGHHLLTKWDQDLEGKKITLFEKAIELDPEFASAYSSIAATLNSRWFVLPGKAPNLPELKHALSLAQRSVAIDPLDSRNHVNLAWGHLLAGRHECAVLHFSNALRLNSVNPNVLIAAALAYSFSGNYKESRELCMRAFELNPAPPVWYHGYRATIAFLDGQFEECVEAVRLSDRVFPDIMAWSAAANYRLGKIEIAQMDLEVFYEDLGQSWAGEMSPSPTDMLDWFTDVFPIKHRQQSEVLRSSLEALSGGKR